MRSLALSLLLPLTLAAACARASHADPAAPADPTPAAVNAVAAPVAEVAVAPAETAADVGTCSVVAATAPAPLPPPVAPDAAAPCKKIPKDIARKLKKQARELWSFEENGSTLRVDFACDNLGPGPQELIVEGSAGHGFSLYLDRIRRRDDGDYDLVRLDYGPSREPAHGATRDVWDEAAAGAGVVKVAVLPRARFERTLATMRAAIHLEFEVQLPPPSETSLGGGAGFSSHDFHVAYRFVDAAGRGRQDFWVGYEGSDEQRKWIPLSLMSEAYDAMVWSDDVDRLFAERAPTDEDRRFFAERFATARDRNAEYGYWYLRERLLMMARQLGSPGLVPDLLVLASVGGEHSEARTQAIAVDVLTGLTGYDPRWTRNGQARPVGAAAKDMVAACGGARIGAGG